MGIDWSDVPNLDPLGIHPLGQSDSLLNPALPHGWVEATMFAPAIHHPENDDKDPEVILGRWSSYYQVLGWKDSMPGDRKIVGDARLLINDFLCPMVAKKFEPSIIVDSDPGIGDCFTRCVMFMQASMRLQQLISKFQQDFAAAPHTSDYMIQAVSSLRVSIALSIP